MTAPQSLNVRKIRTRLKPFLALCDSALSESSPPPISKFHSLNPRCWRRAAIKSSLLQDEAQSLGAPPALTGTCGQPWTHSRLSSALRPSSHLEKGSNEEVGKGLLTEPLLQTKRGLHLASRGGICGRTSCAVFSPGSQAQPEESLTGVCCLALDIFLQK